MPLSMASWIALAAVVGLVVGSFLNVVVHRLPRMLERAWGEHDPGQGREGDAATFNLAVPASHCPACHRPLSAWENIPVLSYLALRGRCRGCAAPIPARYPLIELAAGLGAVISVGALGPGAEATAVVAVYWTLLALSVIDLEHYLLPDQLTLPLLWAGLLWSVFPYAEVAPRDAVIGAAAGYLSLWSVYHGFRLATGKEGMGYGDFKLTAALGAWLGWNLLPALVLLAAVSAVVAALLPALAGRPVAGRLPFGPFLALAGWVLLLVPAAWVTTYGGLTP